MSPKSFVYLGLIAAVAIIANASPAGGDQRLEKLYRSFMAPCCWQGNLQVHDSGKAEEVRAEIRQMVAAGKTDGEIKAVLVQEYSKRILALPEGVDAQWLWWTPWLVALVGLGAVALTIRHLRHRPTVAPAAGPPIDIPDSDWDT